jgi:V/A-type H+-transporting ATPase subunit E
MSIHEIEKKILEDAQEEAARINKESQAAIQRLDKTHAEKRVELKSASARQSNNHAEDIKRSIIVPARLEARKALLEAKQKILGKIYAEVKKEKKLSEAELAKIREETEVQAAQVLFHE